MMDVVLISVVVSDGAELQQVNTDILFTSEELLAVFAAAPRLQLLSAGFVGDCRTLPPLLRNDPPFGPLRVSAVATCFEDEPTADVLAIAAALAAHESVNDLDFELVEWPRALNALVDAATQRHLSRLTMDQCAHDADTVPAMARLLHLGSLTELYVRFHGFPEAQKETVPVLCAALRACRTLKVLSLYLSPPDGTSRTTIMRLLDAAASLPALKSLHLGISRVQDAAAAGQALAAFLSANLPSLRTLRVNGWNLGDDGVAALLDGLAANTHLRELYCQHNNLSDAFHYDRLLPALAALEARANRAA